MGSWCKFLVYKFIFILEKKLLEILLALLEFNRRRFYQKKIVLNFRFFLVI